MSYLVFGYKQGTGSLTPTLLFEDYTESVADWVATGGTKSVETFDGRTWARLVQGVGTRTLTSPETWEFYHNRNYQLTFYSRNVSSGSNYLTQVHIGPFGIMGYRDGSDYAGVRSTSDTWDNISTNGFSVDTRGTNTFWDMRYDSLDATTAQVTVYKDTVLVGSKTINKSSLNISDGQSVPTCVISANNDSQGVSTIIMMETVV